jgi:hypothetical protein
MPSTQQVPPSAMDAWRALYESISLSMTPLLQGWNQWQDSWAVGRQSMLDIQNVLQQWADGWQRVARATISIGAAIASAHELLQPPSVGPMIVERIDLGVPGRKPAGYLPEAAVTLPRIAGRAEVASRPYATFKQLGAWLNAADEDVADAVGVRRTTPYAWRREQRTPNPRTLRRLYQLHSALSAVRQHLGEESASEWLYEAGERRRTLFLTGDISALDRDIDAIVFHGGLRRIQPGTWRPTDHAQDEPGE